ncbi:MAG: SusD/RagB family nutrient-binding outer membrane lipoprotein [Alloprevotella sp.]|nr:SusD/RagB family nutrient-binding outer membrane lipoprotein [Alloprevotella sp.]
MNKFIYFLALVLGGLGLQSCLDFDDEYSTLNSDQDINLDTEFYGQPDTLNYRVEISEEMFDSASTALNIYLRSMITGQYCMLGGKEGQAPGSHAYQYQYICTDGYAQYAVVPHYYFAYSTDHNYNSTYYINTSFNPGPSGRFIGMKNAIVPAMNHPLADSIPEIKAVNLLIYDYGAAEVMDVYGGIPYQEYKENRTVNPYTYQGLEEVYLKIVENIDTIVNCFRYYGDSIQLEDGTYKHNRPDWYKEKLQKMLYRYGKVVQDAYTGREGFDSWIRFANSLKLRMAMRIVKVKPELAKQWAEEAVAGGVIESYEQQVGLTPMNEGFSNPLLEITKTWNDSRLGASFESLLMSLDHPYTKYMFNKNSEVLKNKNTGEVTEPNTRIVGLRAGGHFGEDQQYAGNQYVGVSQVNPEGITMAPIWMIKWAEVDFLRAEGALRGWDMGGDAQFFYERGIRNASLVDPLLFDYDYADLVEAYLQKETATDYTYVDPFGDTPDMPSVTKIGVKWNEGDDRETKLEKIITQKYIALYPNSYEAWAELRRTGYPKLFPVLNPWEGDESLDDGDMIRRMPYPGREDDSTNNDIERSGLDALGGPDLQGFRLWWDVEGPNF